MATDETRLEEAVRLVKLVADAVYEQGPLDVVAERYRDYGRALVPYMQWLLAQSAALRDQLAALVAVDPIVRYGSGDYVCHFCYAEHHNRRVQHADDCPWQMAQGLAARTPTPGAAGAVETGR
jgi:hypothetical protein